MQPASPKSAVEALPQGAPLVSVILTVFRRRQYIEGALRSVLGQTLHDLEVLVAHDSDEADIEQAVRGVGDCRVHYFSLGVRVGVAEQVQRAAERARGKYVALLNDDDEWYPEFLEKLVHPLEQDAQLALSFCTQTVIDAHGNVQRDQMNLVNRVRARLPAGPVADLQRRVVQRGVVPVAMGTVMRTHLLRAVFIPLGVDWAYDHWIALAITSDHSGAYFVKEPLVRYRHHAEMESERVTADREDARMAMWRAVLAAGWFPQLRSSVEQQLKDVTFRGAVLHLQYGQPERARELFRAARQAGARLWPLVGVALSWLPSRLVQSLILRWVRRPGWLRRR